MPRGLHLSPGFLGALPQPRESLGSCKSPTPLCPAGMLGPDLQGGSWDRLGAPAWWLDPLGRVVWGEDQAGPEGSQGKKMWSHSVPQEAHQPPKPPTSLPPIGPPPHPSPVPPSSLLPSDRPLAPEGLSSPQPHLVLVRVSQDASV